MADAARDTYDQLQALNWSSLKALNRSPLHFRWLRDHPEPDKPAYALGRAAHCAILEPAEFSSRYAVYSGRRDARTRAYQEWQAKHPGVTALRESDYDAVMAMAEAVRNHRVASRHLQGGRAEETITWTDPRSKLLCKGRLDYVRPDGLVDLKTTSKIAPDRWLRDCATYLYHGQVAWYHNGATLAGAISRDADLPVIIAVETSAPYDVAVYRMTHEAMSTGLDLVRALLDRYVACTAADLWPGVAPEEIPLELPSWADDGRGYAGDHIEELWRAAPGAEEDE